MVSEDGGYSLDQEKMRVLQMRNFLGRRKFFRRERRMFCERAKGIRTLDIVLLLKRIQKTLYINIYSTLLDNLIDID